MIIFVVVFLSEGNCVRFWDQDEDQKAPKENLFVPIQMITWEDANADLLPRAVGTFHPPERHENEMTDESHLDIFWNLN